MITCLIGGGNHLTDDLADINAALAPYVKPTDKLVVIPFAKEEDGYERWMKSVVHNYSKLGITNYHLVSIHDSTESIIEALNSAQILFLAGGRTERLLQRIKDKGIADHVRNFPGLTIGYSAGALILCQDAITTKDEDYPETIVEKGLGIVDFCVEVHYTERVDQELSTLSEDRTIYALPDGAAVLVDNERNTHFINTVHTFVHGQKQV